MAIASVVIPAHDEASVIERCLRRLLNGAERGELEVVVVCNGCHDETAELARRAAPEALVIEIPVASKVAALNAGDGAASVFPRCYLDADVELGIDALRATVQALADGALCAAPAPHHSVEGRTWVVRRFYAAHERLPFFTGPGVVGNGVYVLSRAGRARFGRFPELTADDQFVLERFASAERATVRSHRFVIHPPRTVAGVIKVRTRSYRGNAELRARVTAEEPDDAAGGAWALGLLGDRSVTTAVPVWLGINAIAKVNARRARGRRSTVWERDDSSRAR